jgi:hypothetical protein
MQTFNYALHPAAAIQTRGGQARRRCMREDIYWVGAFKVKPEQFDDFRQVVAPLVAATKQEPGALA